MNQKAKSEPMTTAPSMKAAASAWKIHPAILKTAKRVGCDAFHASGRIDRTRFFAWLKNNRSLAEQAQAEGEQRDDLAELRRKKLENEVTLGEARIARIRDSIIGTAEAIFCWEVVWKIASDEASGVLPPELAEVFATRVESRIGTPFAEFRTPAVEADLAELRAQHKNEFPD